MTDQTPKKEPTENIESEERFCDKCKWITLENQGSTIAKSKKENNL